mmetsp:Transcript_30256/g.54793  ORF Transcript_30256/g.54793 Transcript_30256/m.54793 type:complete len:249 (-) Transcript_30256:243-989(-)
MNFSNFISNPGEFYSSAMGSMASAGFPPANTPSSACACCGKLCDHKNGQVPQDAMECKLCRVCKSYTYILCSNKCLKADRKRHAPDCNERMKGISVSKKQQEKEKSHQRMQEMCSFASEGARPDDNDNIKSFRSLMQGGDAADLVKERKKEADTLREENCTSGLKLRNKQLHHATDVYKKRINLEKVGDPPHDTNCRYCKKAAKVNPKTFQTNMARCSKCLLVRYCSRDCQVADRKNHKSECRDGKFQ